MSVKNTLMGATANGEKYVRISWAVLGLTIRKTFGVKVNPACWSDKMGKAKKGIVNEEGDSSEYVNSILDKTAKECLKYESLLEKTEKDISENELSGILSSIIESAKSSAVVGKESGRHPLLPIYLEFIEKAKNERVWAKETEKSYMKLVPFFKKDFRKSYIEDIGLSWMEQFYSSVSAKLTERTVINMMVNVRSFIRWVIEKYGYGEEALSFKYKARANINDLMYLSKEELERLVELRIPKEGGYWQVTVNGRKATVHRTMQTLDTSRKMFLFCCVTGLRFSDMQRLVWAHVFRDSIKMYTKKTMKPVEIALNPVSRGILDEMYNEDSESGTDSFVFPRIANADMNRDLKIIGHLLRLDGEILKLRFKKGRREESSIQRSEALTTHSGRHTFVVHALSSGVPGNVLMSWTGHSDYDSLQPYIGVTSDAKKKSMQIFERWIEDVFE